MSAPQPPGGDATRLREHLTVLRLAKWPIAAIVGATVLATLTLSVRQTPLYESRAEVLVKPLRSDIDSVVPVESLVDMDTERKIAESDEVARLALRDLGDGLSPDDALERLSVSVPANTRVLEFGFVDADPLQAQAGADAFARAYIEYKTEEARAALNDVREPILARVAELTAELQRVNASIASRNGGQTPEQQSQRDLLNQELAVLRADLPPAIPIDPGDVLRRADLPSAPSTPNHAVNATLALVAGLALGIGFAFLRERLDDRLRGREDLETQAGAPTLAVVPKVALWRNREESRLVTIDDPKSAASEAYRTLRTSMLFAAGQQRAHVVMVASASAGEGKTTTAANLAVVLAHADKRVIVVSADLRKPRLHRFFNLANRRGLVDVLAGKVEMVDALLGPGIDGLRVLPAGRTPARPAEMLGSAAMRELLGELQEIADFILIDTAPLLPVADALPLAPLTDGVLLVADAEVTTRGAVAHAREQLEQVGGVMLGAVLNNFDPARSRTPYYSPYRYADRYRYGYRQGPYGYAAPERLEEERIVTNGRSEPTEAIAAAASAARKRKEPRRPDRSST